MSEDLEIRLLASLPDVEAFQALEDRGITEASFTTAGPLYHYIKQIVEDHDHLPRLRDLQQTFQVAASVRREPHEYDWLLDEFLKLGMARQVQEIVDRNVSTYGELPQALVDHLIHELTAIQTTDKRHISSTDITMARRMQGRKGDNALIVGIPTSISYFDGKLRMGWLPGELIGVIGRTYTGKTWMMMMFGLTAWMHDKRVLMLSPELSVNEAEDRFDALLCGRHDIPVDINDFYRGIKPTKDQLALAGKMPDDTRWTTLASDEGKPFRMSEIPRLLRKWEPDVLLVDGLSFLATGHRDEAPWQTIFNLSYGLKNMAIGTNTVIIVTHQANRDAHNTNTPPGLHQIAFGDAYAQACDRVLALSRSKQEKNVLMLTVQKYRRGEPEQSGIEFHFDPTHGKIIEKPKGGGTSDSRPRTGGSGPNGGGLPAGPGDEDPLSIP